MYAGVHDLTFEPYMQLEDLSTESFIHRLYLQGR